MATNDLLGLAQVAGQFGVRGTGNILKFVDTIARLQSATDLVGEDGARAIARILAVTKQGVQVIDKFGSVLVALGNNFETTESRIVATTNEIIRGIGTFGVSAQNAAALGATIDALGGKFEAAGSAVATTFSQIDKAVGIGGNALTEFSRIIGTTNEKLRKDFREDSFETFRRFIFGLERIKQATGSVTKELDRLGLSDKRVRKGLLPLIDNTEKLTFALKIANDEFRTGKALREESARAFNTLGSDLTRFTNSLVTLGNTITNSSSGPLREFIQNLTLLAKAANNYLESQGTGLPAAIAVLEDQIVSTAESVDTFRNTLANGGTEAGKYGRIIKLTADEQENLREKIRLGENQIKAFRDTINQTRETIAKEGVVLKEAQQLAALGIPSKSALQKATEDILNNLGAFRNRDLFELQESLRIKQETLQNALKLDLITRRQFEEAKFALQQEFALKRKEQEEEQKKILQENLRFQQGFNSAITSGISNSIQTITKAIIDGKDAFASLGKSILGLVGDLAIFIGQFTIATSIAKLALLDANPISGLAAGAGLIALGTVLKAIGGSGFAGEGVAAGANGSPPLSDSPEAEADEDLGTSTAVTVNVEGTVLDPVGVGQQIAEILNETFNAGASSIQVTNA